MPSEFIQRQVDRLLSEAAEAIARSNWDLVREKAENALRLEPDNSDAIALIEAAGRDPINLSSSLPEGEGRPQVQYHAGVPLAGAGESPAPPEAPSASVGARFIAPAAQAPSVPTSFASGRYQVKRFLGEGGKKRVYLAQDTLLDRDVAFALIKTDGLDDAGRDRITREAQAMGRLGAHPHIVSVFDLGQEPPLLSGGQDSVAGPREHELLRQPYIVTELMDGGDVEGLIEKAPDHRLPLARTLEIGVEVCRALEFAHSHGIVHRDLKPGNVWLTAPGVSGAEPPSRRVGGGHSSNAEWQQTAKIGDFGLAVALDRSRLTQAGMMVGTVSYMPPEQATGGEVTPRSDLYSLGAMLYEMVTGRPPFVGDESVAIITQHLNAVPVSPSWHNPETPPALEALIMRLLEKDPSKRPASAGEVRQALENVATAGAMNRAPTPAGSLSLAGEGQGEGETRAHGNTQASPDNPMYRRTFVGREGELRQLQQAYDAATSGQGSLVMVVGEPGIGKTSICEQAATYAAIRGGRTLVGHCYEEGSLSLPYLPFVEAMRSYVLAREPDGLRSDLGSGAGDVARIVSEIRDRVPVELRDAGDPDGDRWRLLQAVSSFLRNAASVQPLVIVLEDLHDADRGTLDLLVHLAHDLAGARLLLIGTYRDIEVDRAHPLSGALAELRRISAFSGIPLRGLTPDEVQRMMAGVSQQEISWQFAELVHRQTEGNPLFVQEMLRYLVEEGLVERRDGALRRVSEESLAGRIPEGLRDVIGKRLSRLSSECNRLLSVAAVIGRDFRLDTLQAVAASDEEAVVGAMEEGTRVAVLQEQQEIGGVRYRFAHAFFRQTLYEELSAPRRLRLHQEIARALERQYGARIGDHAAELAEHFAQSTDSDDLRKAIHYAEMAAERAMSVYAYGEAARHLEEALEVQEVLDPDDESKRCDLLLALGDALGPAGEPRRVYKDVAERAFALAERLGDASRAMHAARAGNVAMRRFGSVVNAATPEFRRWTDRYARFAPVGSADAVYAEMLTGFCRWATGDFSESWTRFCRFLDDAHRIGDPDSLVTAIYAFLAIEFGPEHLARQLELADEFAGLSPEGANVRSYALGLLFAGYVNLGRGRRDRAEQLWQRLSALAAGSRDANLLFLPLAAEISRLAFDGRLEEGLDAAVRMVSVAEESGSPVYGRHYATAAAFRPYLHLGRTEEALQALDDLRDAAGVQQQEELPDLQARRALCLARLGRMDEASALSHRLMARWFGTDDAPFVPSGMRVFLLEASLLQGDADAVATLSSGLAPAAALAAVSASGVSDPISVARVLGEAAASLGEQDRALEYYRQAIEVCEGAGLRPDLALTHLQLAELLLDHPHPDPLPEGEGKRVRTEAIEHLDSAIGELRAMKMQPALERALRHKEVLKA